MEKFGFIIFLLLFQNNYAQVGIGTTDPQQKLHIASSTGTLRVESLNYQNNGFNGGDLNNDGNLTNDTFPLYVDENGDFTLEFKPLLNSEEFDALNDTNLPASSVYLDSLDTNGYNETNIVAYTITVSRPALLEIKYNMSFDVYYDSSKAIITDNLARRIFTYINIMGDTRKYGRATKCYSSGSLKSVAGTMYNSNTVYVSIPSAGTYDITFIGAVSSNIKSSGASGTRSESTYVEFATGHDLVFFRLH